MMHNVMNFCVHINSISACINHLNKCILSSSILHTAELKEFSGLVYLELNITLIIRRRRCSIQKNQSVSLHIFLFIGE